MVDSKVVQEYVSNIIRLQNRIDNEILDGIEHHSLSANRHRLCIYAIKGGSSDFSTCVFF